VTILYLQPRTPASEPAPLREEAAEEMTFGRLLEEMRRNQIRALRKYRTTPFSIRGKMLGCQGQAVLVQESPYHIWVVQGHVDIPGPRPPNPLRVVLLLVTIEKKSGMNLVRSPEKREARLLRYLEAIGLSMQQYRDLEIAANRPWHKDDRGQIFIPKAHLESALVQACPNAPSGARLDPEQLRALLKVSDFPTGKTKRDSVYEHFVVPKDGRGCPLSNQRRYMKHEVISDFTACGSITFDPGDIAPKNLVTLLTYAGK
jgi:hypothetical protein